MPMPIKIDDNDAFLYVESIDWNEIFKTGGTDWANAQSIEEMADAIIESVDDAHAKGAPALIHLSDSSDHGISQIEAYKALAAASDAPPRADVDTSEIEFCRKASLDRIRELLRQRDEFGQASLLVLLEHFRPDFFAVGQQIITQGVVDLSRATELVEKMNDALMFCSDQYYRVDDMAERAIIKHYLLKIVRGSSGIVNLRGQYHGGWINIRGVATDHKGEILKLMVEVDPFRTPHVMYRYYNP